MSKQQPCSMQGYCVKVDHLMVCHDLVEAVILSIIESEADNPTIQWFSLSGQSLTERPGLSGISPATFRRKLAALADRGILKTKPDPHGTGHSRLFILDSTKLSELIARSKAKSPCAGI